MATAPGPDETSSTPQSTPASTPAATAGPETSAPVPPTLSATPLVPDTTPTGTVPGFPIDATLPLVVAAAEDLAARLGVPAEDVVVVDARAVTWGDSSLGCPEPGMMYLQQLVEGTRVVLEVDGRRFHYHGGNPLFLCEDPKAPSGGG